MPVRMSTRMYGRVPVQMGQTHAATHVYTHHRQHPAGHDRAHGGCVTEHQPSRSPAHRRPHGPQQPHARSGTAGRYYCRADPLALITSGIFSICRIHSFCSFLGRSGPGRNTDALPDPSGRLKLQVAPAPARIFCFFLFLCADNLFGVYRELQQST